MIDCIAAYIIVVFPFLLSIPVLWAFFLIELRQFLALRAGRLGVEAICTKCYYAPVLAVLVTFLYSCVGRLWIFGYISWWASCIEGLDLGWAGWAIRLGFATPLWGLLAVSYATYAKVGEETCTTLPYVIVIRIFVTGIITWLFITTLFSPIGEAFAT